MSARKYDFTGKVALVTGSSSGIGAAIALQLAQYGAQVTITGQNAEALKKVAEQICQVSNGTEPLQLPGDLLDEAFPAKLITETIARFGKLNILVNNAGMGSQHGALKDANLLEEFDRLLKINVRVPVELMQLAAPHLAATGGNIINISSGTSLRPYFVAYSSTKAALNMATQCAALELGPQGIRVNCIVPGPVHTNFLQSMGMSSDMSERFFQQATARSLMGRLGQPEDIASLASFLASDDARNITGAIMLSDSGTFIKAPDNRGILKKD